VCLARVPLQPFIQRWLFGAEVIEAVTLFERLG